MRLCNRKGWHVLTSLDLRYLDMLAMFEVKESDRERWLVAFSEAGGKEGEFTSTHYVRFPSRDSSAK